MNNKTLLDKIKVLDKKSYNDDLNLKVYSENSQK